MKKFALLILSVATAGCVTNPAHYNIDYASLSSRLYVEGPDGTPIEPLGGRLVDVGGIGIGGGAIRLVPGRHWVRTVCPPGSGGIQWTHGQPAIHHHFEIGKAYVLRCKNGYPSITSRE